MPEELFNSITYIYLFFFLYIKYITCLVWVHLSHYVWRLGLKHIFSFPPIIVWTILISVRAYPNWCRMMWGHCLTYPCCGSDFEISLITNNASVTIVLIKSKFGCITFFHLYEYGLPYFKKCLKEYKLYKHILYHKLTFYSPWHLPLWVVFDKKIEISNRCLCWPINHKEQCHRHKNFPEKFQK